VDNEERRRVEREHQHEVKMLTVALDVELGNPLREWWATNRLCTPGRLAKVKVVAKVGLSNPYLATYFYDVLGCKPVARKGRSTNELVLRMLQHKAPPDLREQVVRAANLVLDYRYHTKQLQFLSDVLVDDDGRFRSLYTPTADTGRLKSRKNALGGGDNAQNRPRESAIRRCFVADPGDVLVEVDESQAEDRMVGGMSGDPELLALALASPLDVDIHKLNAALVFECEVHEVSPERRLLGKRIKHGANYDMEGERMAEVALVETEGKLVLDPRDCTQWLERQHTARPGIRKYHRWVDEPVMAGQYLINSWGRWVRFPTWRQSKHEYKAAYAWYPQSEVGVLMNQLGFVALRREIKRQGWAAKIVQQGHDSLVVSVHPHHAWAVVNFLCQSLGQVRDYPGAGGTWQLGMPVGVKVGYRWGDMHEWKVQPAREEFEDVMGNYTRRAA